MLVLVGGVGGAKLAYGLMRILPPERLKIIVNTGDDFWLYGLRICPDLDTVMYTLAGLVNKAHGWGIAGDTRRALEAIQRYGEDAWFGLGDQDLATHMLRTEWWREGHLLTQITARLAGALKVGPQLLPMSDVPVATMIDTVEHGELPFQHYFVKYRWQPQVRHIRFDNIENALPSRAVELAVEWADVILFGPSNPWLSIDPILHVPGMRDLIAARDVPRVALTPIIAGSAVKGPAAKIMRELGYEVSPTVVAHHYAGVINGFVYDGRDDGAHMPGGLRTTTMNTLMDDDRKRSTLARNLLKWIGNWS